MAELKQILVLTLVFLGLSFGQEVNYAASGNDGECIQSFYTFAFLGPDYWSERHPATYSNWQMQSSIPSGPDNVPVEYPVFALETSRIIDEQQEIWVSGFGDGGQIWLVYRPASDEWDSISRTIDNTNLISHHLFVGEDSTLYSSLRWNTQAEFSDLETVPILAKFDEDTRKFVIEEGVMEIPFVREITYYNAQPVLPWPKILLNDQNDFWIFVNYDGLYSYSPDTNTVEKHADISEYPIDNAALAPNGNIFFSRPTSEVSSTRTVFALSEGMLFQFDLELNVISDLTIPDSDWPGFNGMLVDRDGVLRLGATSYRAPNGDWNLMHPDIEVYFDNAGDSTWATPNLIFESSDGRLWYNRFLDGSGGGTAWYDAETGSGCLFNGQASNVIEDFNQQLWMVANGNLYRYSLNSQ